MRINKTENNGTSLIIPVIVHDLRKLISMTRFEKLLVNTVQLSFTQNALRILRKLGNLGRNGPLII